MPILGSIPVLGNLFRSRRTEKIKTNLMVFIKPKILLDGIGSMEVTGEKYNYIRQLQRRDGKVPLMRDAVSPSLPPLEDQVRQMPPTTPPPDIMQEDSGGE